MSTESYRHELKFLCAEKDLRHMERKVRSLCPPDSHVGSSGSYRIKSLYFDTVDDQCYLENLAGEDHRSKYRIRIYDDHTDQIRLECKSSLHDRKRKETCDLSERQYALLTGRLTAHIPPETDETETPRLLERFLAQQRTKLLRPKVIVEYVRTPYIFPAGNVRITFDRNIRSSPQVTDFLGTCRTFRSILPPDVHILEVKYDRMLPGAIRELLAGGQDLRRTSFSKYAMCRRYGIQ